ncbi:dihydroxyacetone kinase transcriptional activator DhaS [Streptococcus suis]|nr:dihydroxyacetone kinase transcriptional activator DhaS [Streptococcus suis]
MASSLITKKRIAKAFKSLLLKVDFDKISIVDIMEIAQIRRQTFYNHFLDKYQLLDWIFENDLHDQITDNLDFISGRQLLIELFSYFEKERWFYVKLFEIRGQNDFYTFYFNYCKTLVEKIWREYASGKIDMDFYQFHSTYQAHAMAELTKSFVLLKEPFPDPNYIIREITFKKY